MNSDFSLGNAIQRLQTEEHTYEWPLLLHNYS